MLEVEGLTKRFGGLAAVSDASLEVCEGEIVALIGPNGAGKTTLFAMISGFLRPDSGTVRFQRRTVNGLKPHAICALGLVRTFQIVRPFANLTVRENIAVGAHSRTANRTIALEQATAVAERVGMGPLLDQRAASLTVAGRKRLELARALATKPELLLLDEVMAGLNATEVAEIVEVIKALPEQGVTILLIEHVMQAVMSLSERVYVLNDGKIIAGGEPSRVTSDPQVIEAYLGHGAAERIQGAAANA